MTPEDYALETVMDASQGDGKFGVTTAQERAELERALRENAEHEDEFVVSPETSNLRGIKSVKKKC